MWFFNRKKPKKRKVFGFLCDPNLARGVKTLARYLEVPIYPLAEHLIQLGAGLVVPALDDEEKKKELQEHLANEHLLVPSFDKDNEYDKELLFKVLENGEKED
jgi:hypothetical protein